MRNALLSGVLLLVGTLLVGGKADADMVNGRLDIEDHVGSSATSVSLRNYDYSGVSDMFDNSYDLESPMPPSGNPFFYSNISQFDSAHPKLVRDTRLPTTSHDTYDIELAFNGGNSSSKANYLVLTFPTADVLAMKS